MSSDFHHYIREEFLGIARQRHAQHASQSGAASMTRLARQLGYADSRSLRRARRRWDSRDIAHP